MTLFLVCLIDILVGDYAFIARNMGGLFVGMICAVAQEYVILSESLC